MLVWRRATVSVGQHFAAVKERGLDSFSPAHLLGVSRDPVTHVDIMY